MQEKDTLNTITVCPNDYFVVFETNTGVFCKEITKKESEGFIRISDFHVFGNGTMYQLMSRTTNQFITLSDKDYSVIEKSSS